MQVCKFDNDRYFSSERYEPDDYVLSSNETNVVPNYQEGKEYVWDGSVWTNVERRTALQVAPKTFSKLDILRKITPTEWSNFETSQIPEVRYAFAAFGAATEVVSDDPLTVQMFDILEATGVIAAGRKTEILS